MYVHTLFSHPLRYDCLLLFFSGLVILFNFAAADRFIHVEMTLMCVLKRERKIMHATYSFLYFYDIYVIIFLSGIDLLQVANRVLV